MTIVEAQVLVKGEVYLISIGDWLYIAVFEGNAPDGKLRWVTQDCTTIERWCDDIEVHRHLVADEEVPLVQVG